MQQLSLIVNGKRYVRHVPPRTLLVSFLRDELSLTGTHIGCDTSQCGACTIHLNGEAVKACSLLAVQADGGTIATIEGVAQKGELHPMQEAFWACHGLQCGFCTPGMIMTALKLVEETPEPTAAEIRYALKGNLCRCTGYENIVKAVREGAEKMQKMSEVGEADHVSR